MNKILLHFLLFFLSFNLSGCVVLGVGTAATTGAIVADERSVGNILDDKVITTKVQYELSKSSKNNSLRGVSANTYEGRVLLTGFVTDIEYKDQAEKSAWLISGVKEVINEVNISSKNKSNTAQDLWMTTKIKTKFLVTKEIHSVNYKVVVYDSVAYLLGIASTQEELDIALHTASEVDGVSKVKNYILVKNDIRRAD
ncbi:BON domain-containing protein [Candidatus Bandiella euplotis]|uniref:BON domain-containing protein n=1 Tax=Candidatus Bandiella euplotis TaxID=1664265 RepID=UPI002B263697|nr:BON domain-containing protein [Candidatus Bandiella woodruffii]